MNSHGVKRALTLIATLLILTLIESVQAGVFTDELNGAAIDLQSWDVVAEGGSTVVLNNQRLVMTQGGPSGFAAMNFKTPMVGDFVATVDVGTLNFPQDNAERIALRAFASPSDQLTIQRTSDSRLGFETEFFLTEFTGKGMVRTPTPDNGLATLKLERIGDVVTGSFRTTSSDWTTLGTFHAYGEGNVTRTIGFALFPLSIVTPGVTAAFYDFSLAGASIVPEPSTWATLAVGLCLICLPVIPRSSRQPSPTSVTPSQA